MQGCTSARGAGELVKVEGIMNLRKSSIKFILESITMIPNTHTSHGSASSEPRLQHHEAVTDHRDREQNKKAETSKERQSKTVPELLLTIPSTASSETSSCAAE